LSDKVDTNKGNIGILKAFGTVGQITGRCLFWNVFQYRLRL